MRQNNNNNNKKTDLCFIYNHGEIQSSVQTPKNKTKKPKHPPHKKTLQKMIQSVV